MKKSLNRGISLLLSVCMVLSILAVPGIIPARAESAETTQATKVVEKNLIVNSTFSETINSNEFGDRVLPTGWTNVGLSQVKELAVRVSDAYATYGDKYSLRATGTVSTTANVCQEFNLELDENGKALVEGKTIEHNLGYAFVTGVFNINLVFCYDFIRVYDKQFCDFVKNLVLFLGRKRCKYVGCLFCGKTFFV